MSSLKQERLDSHSHDAGMPRDPVPQLRRRRRVDKFTHLDSTSSLDSSSSNDTTTSTDTNVSPRTPAVRRSSRRRRRGRPRGQRGSANIVQGGEGGRGAPNRYLSTRPSQPSSSSYSPSLIASHSPSSSSSNRGDNNRPLFTAVDWTGDGSRQHRTTGKGAGGGSSSGLASHRYLPTSGLPANTLHASPSSSSSALSRFGGALIQELGRPCWSRKKTASSSQPQPPPPSPSPSPFAVVEWTETRKKEEEREGEVKGGKSPLGVVHDSDERPVEEDQPPPLRTRLTSKMETWRAMVKGDVGGKGTNGENDAAPARQQQSLTVGEASGTGGGGGGGGGGGIMGAMKRGFAKIGGRSTKPAAPLLVIDGRQGVLASSSGSSVVIRIHEMAEGPREYEERVTGECCMNHQPCERRNAVSQEHGPAH